MVSAKSLLPSNATPVERALSDTIAEAFANLPTGASIAEVVEWSTCPVPLLPYLAWEWSVDEWVPAWSDDIKRSTIAASWDVHSVKGTRYAIERAIEATGLGATVKEWFDYGGARFRFRLDVNDTESRPWTTKEFNTLYRVAIRSKNVRSYLERIDLKPTPSRVAVYAGAATITRITVRPSVDAISQLAGQASLYSGVVARSRIRIKPVVN